MDELLTATLLLTERVEVIAGQIRALKEERARTTGDVRNAYDLVIANKVWTLQTLIGNYWRTTLNLTFEDSSSNASA